MNKSFDKKTTIECLLYILDSELENFAENPSKDHVFYKASRALDGKKAADEMLKEAIKDLVKE